MKIISKISLLLTISLIVSSTILSQPFIRVGEIPIPANGGASFGNMISGLDLDGDGLKEIYAVNNNWNDGGIAGELVPQIWKFEFDGLGGFNMVWSATLNIPLQNTWPALTYGDWDNDGKGEIIWGPVNFTNALTNPNPPRIVVFESAGDGTDNMGVTDGGTGWLPNAQWTLVPDSNANHRPFRWFLNDIDNDGAKELVMCTRAGDLRFAVVSVSDIPDNGDGSETWTLEASDTGAAVTGNTTYDMAILNGTIYLLHNNGDITPVTYSGGTYTVQPILTGVTTGSWNSAQVADIDNDGTDELFVPSWASSAAPEVFLLQQSGDSLISTVIADFSSMLGGTSARLYGSAIGDIENNGHPDMVIGTRGATPNAAIVRVEYMGGDITQQSSYQTSIIDQEYAAGGRWMTINVADIDKDPNQEVLYSEGTGDQQPIVIIDKDGVVPVELTSFSASIADGHVTLSWNTATETNSYGFEVQRAANNEDFRTIGFVEGNGTTSQPQAYSFTDQNTNIGHFSYRLKQVDFDGGYSISDVIEVDFTAPTEFNLAQNYPNPFNPTTTISFGLPNQANVTLRIYNLLGEEVATLINNQVQEAGTHQFTFNASNLASGTYIYTLQAGDLVSSKKMILMK